ncbi:probable prefoldin subunit 4 [Schistocerca americana]|uniref:probable prefoldin subunit 4 n=1 Tax=Schistocerca americana TaxID=7009 RepID=UPI001F4FBBAD|nr:probable prefoldin subunit 4 [Schistocerca americana]XP_047113033.1 probable prefoldin subunit 4 [Schistocerca piceifrons]XP_049959263.1 probable prefoldin subunit 4 [Schistocerca serialis cubense]
MASSNSATFQPDSDVHISYDDQQKINEFARHNARLEDYKDELKSKQNQLKNLEEACDELTLMDQTEFVPYFMGEVFINQDIEQTEKMLEEAKNKILSETKDLEDKCSNIKNQMSELKTYLYAKFGNHINLEADDD